MGSSLSPVVANLYMEHFEEVALQTAPFPPPPPPPPPPDSGPDMWMTHLLYGHMHGQTELEHFHGHLNAQYQNINFTVEHERDKQLAFQDVKVTRTDTELKTSVHCKATHTERYILFHSHHHQRTITGVLRCMRDRGNMICGPESREAEMQHLQQVFQANGFSEDLVRKTLSHQPLPSNPNPPPPPLHPLMKDLQRSYACPM